MDRSNLPPLRSLPRIFVPGVTIELGLMELPEAELHKLRHVLRLGTGASFLVLPGDGSMWLGQLSGRDANILERCPDPPSAARSVRLAIGLPKPESLEEVVRMGTELGVDHFTIFTARRSVPKWDEKKWAARLTRLATIAREAAEVCFRGKLPTFQVLGSLKETLSAYPDAIVLSELEGVPVTLGDRLPPGLGDATLIIGPEGGWATDEVAQIGDRGVTLGPLVLRVDTAAVTAIAQTQVRG